MSNSNNRKFGKQIFTFLVVWTLIFIALIGSLILINPVGSSSSTKVNGLITTDTTWTSGNSPYMITDNVTLMTGKTLTIQEGTIIKFVNNTKLEIRGSLKVEGTSNKHVIFKPYSSEKKEIWHGVHIATDLGGKGEIKYAEFYDAVSALWVDCCEGKGPLNIYDSIFKNNNVAVGGYSGWNIIIERCHFEDNTYAITRADKIIKNSVFKNNEYGLFETERISVYDSTFTENNAALYGGRGELQRCQIYNNNIGVQAFYEGFSMSNNTINNNNVGIYINDYDGYIPPINYNNIFNNTQYNLKSNTKSGI